MKIETIEKNLNLFRFYLGSDDKIMNKAAELGFTPTIMDLKTHHLWKYNKSLMWNAVRHNPNAAYYLQNTGTEENKIMEYAFNHGYRPSNYDLFNNHTLFSFDVISDYYYSKYPNKAYKYNGSNPEVIKKAISAGVKFDSKYVELNRYSSISHPEVCKVIIENNPNLLPQILEYYTEYDYMKPNARELMLIAIKNGYKPTGKEMDSCDFTSSHVSMSQAIEYDPSYRKYYTGNSRYLSILLGEFMPTVDYLRVDNYATSDEYMMSYLIKKDINFIELYEGTNPDILKLAKGMNYDFKNEKTRCLFEIIVNHNFSVLSPFMGKDNISLTNDCYRAAIKEGYKLTFNDLTSRYVGELIDDDLEYRKAFGNPSHEEIKRALFDGIIDDRFIKTLISTGYKLDFSDISLVRLQKVIDDQEVFERAMDGVDLDTLKTMIKKKNHTTKFYKAALNHGYIPDFDDCCNYRMNDLISKEAFNKAFDGISLDNIKEAMKGHINSNFVNAAVKHGYEITLDDLIHTTVGDYIEDSNIINNILDKTTHSEIIDLLSSPFASSKIKQLIINSDFRPTFKELSSYRIYSNYRNSKVEKELIEAATINEIYEALDDENSHGDFLRKLLNERLSNVLPGDLLNLIFSYRGSKRNLIENYEFLNSFLKINNINESEFYQYCFCKNTDWLKYMLFIKNNNLINEFKVVKDYFFEHYYSNDNGVMTCNNFINILMNFYNYKDLCLNLVNKDLSSINNILKFVFSKEEKMDFEINNVDDLLNIKTTLKEKYRYTFKISDNIEELKNEICLLLFNRKYHAVEDLIKVYGGTKELKQLYFNSRNKHVLKPSIEKMISYTMLMESIIESSKDLNALNEISQNIMDNFEMAIECSMYFVDYESKMRELFELDVRSSLSNNIDGSLLVDSLTQKYGVPTYDLRESEYLILGHIKSSNEDTKKLVNGSSSGSQNFICLSAISNRNQVYYYDYGNNIFATTIFPVGNFVQSSIKNMGSNGDIRKNDSDVRENTYREQRGLLETSHGYKIRETEYNNSEVLAFREGLKFNYLVLPDGREPTEEELKIARENNLGFLITQPNKRAINNPNMEEKEEYGDLDVDYSDDLRTIGKTLTTVKTKRKIAVISDCHGNYEAMLAVLEDARIRGCEIYSLGDNIGMGPNPSEVMHLIDEYNVQSIAGNHELYAIEGIEPFIEHLEKTNSVEEARNNSEYTRTHLTELQKNKIKLYPKAIELLVGGEKLLLCHSIYDYNTGERVVDTENYSKVIQGHTHFENETENVKTLSGMAMGSHTKEASYLLIVEDENGYHFENVVIPYNYVSFYHDINESELNSHDKDKNVSFTGVSR